MLANSERDGAHSCHALCSRVQSGAFPIVINFTSQFCGFSNILVQALIDNVRLITHLGQ
jgi:hypothetical protein